MKQMPYLTLFSGVTPLRFSSLPFSRNETSIAVPINGRYVKGIDPDLANVMDVSMTLEIHFAAWALLFNQ
jgi:hypothetical protein